MLTKSNYLEDKKARYRVRIREKLMSGYPIPSFIRAYSTAEELEDMGVSNPWQYKDTPESFNKVSEELRATEEVEGEVEMDKDVLDAIPKGPVAIATPTFSAIKRDGVLEVYAHVSLTINGVGSTIKMKLAEERADGETK